MLIAASKLWMGLAVLTMVVQAIKSGDWQHLLWVTMLPTIGLLAISGSMLVAGKARLAAVALLAIGVMPLVLLTASGGLDDYDVTAVDDIPAATLEVLAYGFTGEIPSAMSPAQASPPAGDVPSPEHPRQLASPSRDVTVPMGGIYFGSLSLIALGVIVLVSKAVPIGFARRTWLRVSPFASLAYVALSGGLFKTELPIWRNDPWLVESLGPIAACGLAGFGVVLLLADTKASLQQPTGSGSLPRGERRESI